MSNTDKQIRKNVQEAIKDLLGKFSKNPKAFHTESDIQCYLYHLLLKKGIKPEDIHTEMHIKPYKYDIVILQEKQIVVEIKYNPNPARSLKKHGGSVYTDMEKLKDIETPYMLILSEKKTIPKYKEVEEEFEKKELTKKGKLFIRHMTSTGQEYKYPQDYS